MTAIDVRAMRAAIAEQMQLITPAGDQVGVGWVAVDDVAWGTYGSVTGVNTAREDITDTGYIIHTHPLPGGLGGGGHDMVAVYLAALPTTSRIDADVLYAPPTAVVTVLTPPAGLPSSVPPPWKRMPVEQQITEVAAQLGLDLTVVDAEPNPIYQINSDPPTALSRVADYLLAGGHATAAGRHCAIPHPNRVRDARRQP